MRGLENIKKSREAPKRITLYCAFIVVTVLLVIVYGLG